MRRLNAYFMVDFCYWDLDVASFNFAKPTSMTSKVFGNFLDHFTRGSFVKLLITWFGFSLERTPWRYQLWTGSWRPFSSRQAMTTMMMNTTRTQHDTFSS